MVVIFFSFCNVLMLTILSQSYNATSFYFDSIFVQMHTLGQLVRINKCSFSLASQLVLIFNNMTQTCLRNKAFQWGRVVEKNQMLQYPIQHHESWLDFCEVFQFLAIAYSFSNLLSVRSGCSPWNGAFSQICLFIQEVGIIAIVNIKRCYPFMSLTISKQQRQQM